MPRLQNKNKQANAAVKFAVTINNYDENSLEDLIKSDKWKYYVFGKEIAPETGTKHLQGYIVFKNRLRMNQVQDLLKHKAHVEVARTSHAANIKYCKKEGDFIEDGEIPIDGCIKGAEATKEKWDNVRKLASANNFAEIPSDIYVRYIRNLKQIAIDNWTPPADLESVCGIWYFGQSGNGKSTKARNDFPNAYFKRANKWFDGYQGQETIIIDDLDKTHDFLAYDLKIWTDKFSFTAETKGGHILIRPKNIVVTSQYTIQEIWGEDPNERSKHKDNKTVEALERRFKQIEIKKWNQNSFQEIMQTDQTTPKQKQKQIIINQFDGNQDLTPKENDKTIPAVVPPIKPLPDMTRRVIHRNRTQAFNDNQLDALDGADKLYNIPYGDKLRFLNSH